MSVQMAQGVIGAFGRLKKAMVVGTEVLIGCSSCGPGSNTAVFRGYHASDVDDSEPRCNRIPVTLETFPITADTDGKILCIGHRGRLRWCGKDEFMAVSHVWEHGWQGKSGDGVCLQTLDFLLDVAARFNLRWVWLDVAMISGNREVRARSINSMSLVYSLAKVTTVFDHLLLAASSKLCSNREKAFLIAVSDWMTRVWTMEEALLSSNLSFVFGDEHIQAEDLMKSLIDHAEEKALHWQQYGAITDLCCLSQLTREKTLDRVFFMAQERLTSQKEDLARSVFPLFGVNWPGASFTLEQAQEKLLKHLGQDAPRCHAMHGPIMPRPWS